MAYHRSSIFEVKYGNHRNFLTPEQFTASILGHLLLSNGCVKFCKNLKIVWVPRQITKSNFMPYLSIRYYRFLTLTRYISIGLSKSWNNSLTNLQYRGKPVSGHVGVRNLGSFHVKAKRGFGAKAN
jgi:hypothetical protein